MERSKKLVLVAHCLLNSNSKVAGLVKKQEEIQKILSLLLEKKFGIIQLPCPELTLYGIKRWGHVKEQFDTPYYRRHCREIFQPYLDQIIDYRAVGYEIKALIGIDGSPSCGVNKTCSACWQGEVADLKPDELMSLKIINEAGIFIEVIKKILKAKEIEIPLIAVDEENPFLAREKIEQL
ncbi:putative secreted protein [Halanaerobium saccharolyticum]|jgi:predicted secreted protein|uniref:Putative secreted protein n=1 Tax=Halanaerobium saccharolyticum TaxID=43595 RepID=A0A4R7ZB98_9FIRM|nr:CD3072 family TudS-related putative desulfidase [Halanaerobium saccharolyticum]RAK11745.1 putative secreted protein [Halanaerobium saccharolyticum]TDW07586.1 putative secreted protein [Halanaerobium saccharolyticum]TDX64507.1 putative secreted protein [Halanaerobium saccharolyticum]